MEIQTNPTALTRDDIAALYARHTRGLPHETTVFPLSWHYHFADAILHRNAIWLTFITVESNRVDREVFARVTGVQIQGSQADKLSTLQAWADQQVQEA